MPPDPCDPKSAAIEDQLPRTNIAVIATPNKTISTLVYQRAYPDPQPIKLANDPPSAPMIFARNT